MNIQFNKIEQFISKLSDNTLPSYVIEDYD